MNCAICDTKFEFVWTDHHGIGACITCNSPYVIYHYEGEGSERKRVDKPPECIVLPEYIETFRRYWQEKHRLIPNGCNFNGSSYEQCSASDFAAFKDWMTKHEAERAA